MTTPARTAVDVAAGLRTPEALITLDSAARLALVENVGSSRVRNHYARPRSLAAAVAPLKEAAAVAGTQFTRAGLARLVALADPRRESGLESLSFGNMVDVGFPMPELQVHIATPEGDAYVDFLWREQMVIGEADGLKKYATPADLHREKLRQELLERMGYIVIRWTWEEMYLRPAAVLRRIEAALDARAVRALRRDARAAASPGPRGRVVGYRHGHALTGRILAGELSTTVVSRPPSPATGARGGTNHAGIRAISHKSPARDGVEH